MPACDVLFFVSSMARLRPFSQLYTALKVLRESLALLGMVSSVAAQSDSSLWAPRAFNRLAFVARLFHVARP
jgi:hypothetical protein